MEHRKGRSRPYATRTPTSRSCSPLAPRPGQRQSGSRAAPSGFMTSNGVGTDIEAVAHSGGIDSGVVAALCVAALGKECVSGGGVLPAPRRSDPVGVSQVYALAEHLGVSEEIRCRPSAIVIYSLPQSQEEFYFSLPHERMDLCLVPEIAHVLTR